MPARTSMSVLALVAGIILPSISAFADGAEMRFHPAAASGNIFCMPGEGSCGETEIILYAGGVTVTLFLEISHWDTAGGGHPGDWGYFLGAFQGVVDSETYAGGVPGNPGTLVGFDLVPVGQPHMGFEGAFQALKVCASDPSDPLGTSDLLSKCLTDAECPAGWDCRERWDYIFFQADSIVAVSTATLNYSWNASGHGCREDPRDGTRFYGGTLLLEVPAGAMGTYNVDLYDDANDTRIHLCPGNSEIPITPPTQITIIPVGIDCNDNGIPDELEPDSDGDGAIDECEGCPDDPNKTEPGVCGCGVDDSADADGDGVPDCIDQCPGLDDAVFAPDCVAPIPALPAWGVVAMALLLLVAATVLFLRRAPVTGRSHST